MTVDENTRRLADAIRYARYKLPGEGWRVVTALVVARDALPRRGTTGADIVFKAIQDAYDVDRRMVVGAIYPNSARSLWPDHVTTPEEKAEAAKQRRVDEAAGDDPAAIWGIRLTATQDEIKTMEAVIDVFRKCLTGKNADRDWRIVQSLAMGKPEAKVARLFHVSRLVVRNAKERQCTAIWDRMIAFVPDSERRSAA